MKLGKKKGEWPKPLTVLGTYGFGYGYDRPTYLSTQSSVSSNDYRRRKNDL